MNRSGRLAFWLTFLLFGAVPAGAGAAADTLSDDHRLQILRLLAYEYATTLHPLPACRGEKEALEVSVQTDVGPHASGAVNEDKLRQILANRGPAVQPGEIVQVTGVEFQRSAILFEINGGGKKKKKWYERITIQGGTGGTVSTGRLPPSGTPPPPGSGTSNTFQGSWIVLSFSSRVPDLTGAEVKKLLGSVLDFSRQSAAVPWIETIPEEFREAIKNKKAKVGMNREMVLAALGRPDRKVREIKNDQETEDWIYGYPPFVTFVTFVGDQVVEVKEFR